MKAIRTLLHDLSPNCRHFAEMKSRALDEPLLLHQTFGMNLHMLLCRWCRRYARQVDLLQSVTRTAEDRMPDSSELNLSARDREQLKETLRAAKEM